MAGAEKTEHEKLLLFSQEKERLRAKETIDLAHILLIQAAIYAERLLQTRSGFGSGGAG